MAEHSRNEVLKIHYLLVQNQPGTYKISRRPLAKLSRDSTVAALLDAAKKEVCGLFPDGHPERVTLDVYTLYKPLKTFQETQVHLGEELGDLNARFFEEHAVVWSSEEDILDLGKTDGNIVVVYQTSGKRQRSESNEPDEDKYGRLKRSKVATLPPSTVAQQAQYEQLQLIPEERILDDRPKPDLDIPPVQLLYEGYGEFLDISLGLKEIPATVDTTQLWEEVDKFASSMSRFFRKEDKRRDAALPILDDILKSVDDHPGLPLIASSIGSVRTDGDNLGKVGLTGGPVVVEIKNEQVGTSALAEPELVGYFAHGHVRAFENFHDEFEKWGGPGLGITIVGPVITFYAITPVGHQYRAVSLTPSLSCLTCAVGGYGRDMLYRAFAAAAVLHTRIFHDNIKISQAMPPELQPTSLRLPSINRARVWSTDEYLSFRIQKLHHERQANRFLYLAETSDNRTILVKFAREYSIDLHAFCAERGHAPRILAFEQLPGGWKVIAMEYIKSGVVITKAPNLKTHRDRWSAELKQLVGDFHAAGLVHGDLRDPNIMCDGEIVLLLDFDWAGKDGEVFYPTPNLNTELLEGRNERDMRITKDDDIRVLEKTLVKLRIKK